MMKFNLFSLLTLALVFTIGFTSCDDDDVVEPQERSITEIAADDPQFSTLVSALTRTGLDQTLNASGQYTVFAPTNTAFQQLGVDLSTLSDAELTDILLYHVLGAEVKAGDIAAGQTYVSTASTAGPNNTQLSMLIENNNGVSINGSINVTSTDIDANNGVIHVVDGVIMPLDVVGHAAANSNFTELVGALGAASGDLVSVLSGTGPFTVFAPLNSAFDAISDVVATLSADDLAGVLTYHVASGNVLDSDLSDGQVVTTVNGATFTINIANDGVTITDAGDNVSNIILTNVQGTNGVIHVIDTVILP